VGGVIDVSPRTSRFDPHGPRIGIDPNARHLGQVDDQPVLHQSEPGAVVTAAPDRGVEAVFAAEVHGRDHVRDAGALGYQSRTLVDHRVVDRPCLLERRVVGSDQFAT